MAAWGTVDGTGATKVLAYSFLLDETEQSFQWACECFKDAFRASPAFVFTDSDVGMEVAIAAVFPAAKHLLCVWHLSKNMFTNIKAACGNDDAMWHRMLHAWWLIVKQSDESSRDTFDAEWARLTAMLDESVVTGKSMASARKWLEKMAAIKERWAYRWTWQWLTLGIHSTQRIESLHSHIMGYLRANTLLTDLVPQLELFGETVASRASTRDFRHIRLEQSAGKVQAHPFIDSLSAAIHPYALMLVKSQLQQSNYYRVDPTATEGVFLLTRMSGVAGSAAAAGVEADGDDADVGLDSNSFTTPSRTTTFTHCSCQYTTCYGIPCRHIFRLYEVKQVDVPAELCSPRWRYQEPARVRSLVEEHLRRNPKRTAMAATLSGTDRFALTMQAARAVADLAATDSVMYERAREGLKDLVEDLRDGAGPIASAGAKRGGGAAAPKGKEQCRACWGFGHRKTSKACPRYGLEALLKPTDAARAPVVTILRRTTIESDGEEEGEEEEVVEDEHENVCHGCSSTGQLYCCSTCSHAYCDDCLTLSSRAGLEKPDWRCPICTGGSAGRVVGNPQGRRQQACGKFRARKRGPADPTPAAGRAAKRARRASAKEKGTLSMRMR